MMSIGLTESIVLSAACVLTIVPLIAGLVAFAVVLTRRKGKSNQFSSHD
ncbi:MAG: hypothetical protein PVH41_10350 [Anaerolineae bacterium]|jgi:positive regulator of sigma E activity